MKLPPLFKNKKEIKRVSSIKFLGVILDENLNWNDHLNTIENKVSKNIGILYKAKSIINSEGLRSLYYSFVHSYLNYGNLSWGSTHKTKLKRLASKQKQAIRIINGDNEMSINEKMEKLNILNVYKINLYQSLIFMYRVKNKTIPYVFQQRFEEVNHQYPTRFSHNNYSQGKIKLSQTKFAISSRGPRLWNNILTPVQKMCTSKCSFKKSIKETLIKLCNESNYF